MPILTQEMLEAGLSDNGAFNLAQLKAILPSHEFTGTIGTWSLHKGWKQRVIGQEINQTKYEKFLALKNKHLKQIRHKQPELTLFA